MIKNKRELLVACAAIAAASLVVSNIITNKQVSVFGWAVSAGSFCVPISYVIDDILAEVYGYKIAKTVIFAGFFANMLAIAYFELTIAAPAVETFTAQAAFETVLGCTWRTTLASFIAYLAGSVSNAKIMQLMHDRDGERGLFARCMASTVVGEFLDMAVFVIVAFTGVLPLEVMVQLLVASPLVKCAVELVFYPIVTKHAILWAKELPE